MTRLDLLPNYYTSLALPCLPRQRMEKKTQMKKVLAFLIPLVTSFLHKVATSRRVGTTLICNMHCLITPFYQNLYIASTLNHYEFVSLNNFKVQLIFKQNDFLRVKWNFQDPTSIDDFWQPLMALICRTIFQTIFANSFISASFRIKVA